MRILIVDDSKKDRLFFKNTLTDAGFEDTVFADSADLAFKVLKLNEPDKGNCEIDLILMDIGMPGLNGIEALRKIQKAPHLKDIPVIMVTSEPKDENLIQAFESGAMDFIPKPMNKVELLARLGASLRLKHEIDRRKKNEKELKKANLELARQTSLDGLTKIANRRRFDQYLEQECRRAARSEVSICLIMADIDHFKNYNDTYGHQAGDECLKSVAQNLSGMLKRPADLAARYGGEEFAIILPDTELEGALELAEKMRLAIKNLKINHESSPVQNHVTISLGITCLIPNDDNAPNDLVAYADQALYQAKNNGRDQVAFKIFDNTQKVQANID